MPGLTKAILYGNIHPEEILRVIERDYDVKVRRTTISHDFLMFSFSMNDQYLKRKDIEIYFYGPSKRVHFDDFRTDSAVMIEANTNEQTNAIFKSLAYAFGADVCFRSVNERWDKIEAKPEAALQMSDIDRLRLKLEMIMPVDDAHLLIKMVEENSDFSSVVSELRQFQNGYGQNKQEQSASPKL